MIDIKVLILNCDFDKNQETNGAQLIKSHLSAISVENVSIKNMFDNPFLSGSELSSDRIIITGSRASVYEDLEWIKNLLETVKKLGKIGTPTFGVCFGFQVVAKALGGKVEKSGLFEEGFGTVTLTGAGGNHFIFSGFPGQFSAYQSHGDVVTKVPDNATILAKNETCIQAYSLGNFCCVQFHPEISPKIAEKMALRDGKNPDKILDGVGSDYNLPASIFHNFIKQAEYAG